MLLTFSREDLLSKKLLTCVQCVSRLRPKICFIPLAVMHAPYIAPLVPFAAGLHQGPPVHAAAAVPRRVPGQHGHHLPAAEVRRLGDGDGRLRQHAAAPRGLPARRPLGERAGPHRVRGLNHSQE